jgi:hypothetical protein
MANPEVMNWEAIVHEHGRVLFVAASRILGNVGDAEDVVQEVFLEAFRLRERRASGTVLQRRLADDLEVDQPSLVEFIKGRRVINGLFGRGAGGGVIVVVEYGRIRVTDNLGNTYGLVVVRRNDK